MYAYYVGAAYAVSLNLTGSFQMSMYDEVTARIIAELESGAIPWVKPWSADSSANKNIVSGKAYRGINRLLLGMQSMSCGYASCYWASFKQWQARGGCVRKGEKGTKVVFFSPVEKTTKNAQGEDETDKYAVLKTYFVFNSQQVDGAEVPSPEAIRTEFEAHQQAEQTILDSGAAISWGGDAAFYAPSSDRIQMPNKASFQAPAHYYATAFHELVHWTGAKHRLDRDLSKGRYGDSKYAFEELVAELGAAFLCQEHGIAGDLRHAGYIASWLKALRDDSKAIFKASALAEKAAGFIQMQEATQEPLAA